MEENWYVEWRGWLTLVITNVAWIVASTEHAHRDVWNALNSVTAQLEGLRLCVLFGILTPTFRTDKGCKPSAHPSSLADDVTRLVK